MKNSKNQAEMSLTDADRYSVTLETIQLSVIEPKQLETITAESLHVIDSKELTDAIGKSLKAFQFFDKSFMAIFRARILPLINEAVHRIKDLKQEVNSCTEVEAFYESLGLKPGTVRQWKMRAKQLELEESTDGPTASLETEPTETDHVDAPKRLRISAILKQFPAVTLSPKTIKDANLDNDALKTLAETLQDRYTQIKELYDGLPKLSIDATKPKKAAKKKVVTTGTSEEKPNYLELAKQTMEHQDAVAAKAAAAKTPAV
jgi:hypothetical protein